MYICDMCGKKFETKPDYCDCGNDTFQNIQPAISKKTSDNKMILWLAVGFIVFLTFILLIVAPKDNKKILSDTTNNQQPSVTKTQTTPQPELTTPNQFTTPQTNNVIPPTKPQPIAKTSVKPQTAKSVNKPQTTKKQVTKIQAQPKAKQTKTLTGTSTKTTTAAKVVPVTKSTTQTAKPQTQPQTKQTNTTTNKPAISEEYYNYKLTLRQALFSKLSVASVQGSGSCGIEFSIDSTGKLINRGFTFQSDNKSVNDEVYKMLMRMPKFYPPPSGVQSEKIKMVFKFNNGSYYVNYVN